MEKMRYDIKGLGRFIVFKGKPIRTPCVIDTDNKKEIDLLEFFLHANCMKYNKYPVKQPEQKPNNQIVKPKVKPVQEAKVDKKEAVTILEKLAVDEKIEGLNNEKN